MSPQLLHLALFATPLFLFYERNRAGLAIKKSRGVLSTGER